MPYSFILNIITVTFRSTLQILQFTNLMKVKHTLITSTIQLNNGIRNKFSVTVEVIRVTVYKLLLQVGNQSWPGLLLLLFLLKSILLIVGPEDRVLLHELKECIQYFIRELCVGHLWYVLLSSFGGLGRGLGGGLGHFLAGLRLLLSDLWLLHKMGYDGTKHRGR